MYQLHTMIANNNWFLFFSSGNYLEQGVERIVDQVVNPKVASVFIPQVEDLVYDFLGISRKKSVPTAETSTNGKSNDNDLLPTDLEAVSPGSVKSNDDMTDMMDLDDTKDETKMEIDEDEKSKLEIKEDSSTTGETNDNKDRIEILDTQMSGVSGFTPNDSDSSMDKIAIPLPANDIKPEDIPPPENSPPKVAKVELESIELPREPITSTDIPLPDGAPAMDKEHYFKPINVNSDDDSSSDSSLRRNMSPLTPIRNFNNENSCDAQQAFENESSEVKSDDIKEPSTFRFAIENKSPDNGSGAVKTEKKIDPEQTALSYQFSNQVNLNTFNTPLYDDSSNSNLLHIDYESDANSKTNTENKVPDTENSEDLKKQKKVEEKKSSHKSSHNSRDSHRHSVNKDRRSDSKHSSSRDSSRHDRKSSKDDHNKSKSTHKEESKDRNEKKDSRDSSKHRSSHKSSSTNKDSKSHKSSSSSSSQRHSSSKHSDEKKSSSSSHKDKSEKSSEKSSKDSKEKSSKDSKSSSHRSDKDRKSSSSSKSKHDEKDKKKEKKETDDHYSLSGRGNHNRRSTDRDSNDGSSSSKGSNHPASSKSSESKKESKGNGKSDNTSASSDSTSPCDKEHIIKDAQSDNQDKQQAKPIVRVDTHLEIPIAVSPRLPFVPDVTLKKPKYAANLQEARKLMKMRKFLDEEQKRMNQEAALLLEFQANVRPSLSQVYSSIPGPELEFACITNAVQMVVGEAPYESAVEPTTTASECEEARNNVKNESRNDALIEILTAAQQVDDIEDINNKIQNSDKQNDVSQSNSVEREEVSSDTKATVQQLDNTEVINVPDSNVDNVVNTEQQINHNNDICTDNESLLRDLEDTMEDIGHTKEVIEGNNLLEESNTVNIIKNTEEEENKKRTELFEVTIITEELSESEDTETEVNKPNPYDELKRQILEEIPDENILEYFGENEKFNAELERDRFSKFLKAFTDKISTNKMYLINCDTYEENILKEISQNFGDFEFVNYYKNGHFKPNKGKNVVKDINVSSEITLPVEREKTPSSDFESLNSSPIFSPVKSECSFELSSDYDAKLEEMVNKTSRQEIMEIILGSAIDESPSKMPQIDYCIDANIESDFENTLKRKLPEVESSVNNNRPVLTPNKIRKLSDSDQITSTTEGKNVFLHVFSVQRVHGALLLLPQTSTQ